MIKFVFDPEVNFEISFFSKFYTNLVFYHAWI